MKILQILPELNVGGVETGTIDLARYLVEHGHGSIVVSHGGELVSLLENGGSKHYKLPVHKKSFWTMLWLIRPLRRIIKQEKVDIVHARSRVPAWIAYFACKGTQAAFITTCHGFYKNRLLSRVMASPKLIIVPSHALARYMIEHFRVPASQIRCIPRSINLERFNISKEEISGKSNYIVGIVGRITPLKGHTYFLEAMAKVIRMMPYVKVWVVGNAPANKPHYRQELEVLVTRLGIKDQVEFFGNRKDIPHLLSRMDVLAMSSIEPESFGRVILEAQAVGVPVVATEVGGVVDIIEDDKTGLLVPPRDPEAMAKEIMRLLNDKKLSQQLVQAAQKKIREEFTLEQMATRTIHVYEELLNSMSILVIKLSSIGDVVLSTASLRALRQRFPNAKIYCLVGKESRQVLNNCPYINGLIVYDGQGKDKNWIKLFKLGRRLAKYKFDKVIDLQNNRKSHLIAFLASAQESYGYNNGKWGFLLTHKIKNEIRLIPPVEHQFQVLKLLDIAYKKENSFLELWPSARDEETVRELLESEWLSNARNIVGINIAASEKWPTKNWPLEYIARLCDLLAEKNIRVVITGLDKDKPKALRVLSLTKSKPAVFTGKTDILQLAVLIKKCRLFITPDSAPLHVAAAVKTPVIVFFGPTDSSRHSPPTEKFVILEKKLECTPCYSSRCRILTHACMRQIVPEEVDKEVQRLLASS